MKKKDKMGIKAATSDKGKQGILFYIQSGHIIWD